MICRVHAGRVDVGTRTGRRRIAGSAVPVPKLAGSEADVVSTLGFKHGPRIVWRGQLDSKFL